MVALLGILIVVWLLSSNIKWTMIAAAAFMLLLGPCRPRRDDMPEPPPTPPHQGAIREERMLSATGLPIPEKRYYAAPPGVLLNGEDW